MIRQFSSSLDSDSYFEWWNATDDKRVYRRYDGSVEFIRQRLASDAYDGIMGFSQGAGLAHQLLMHGAPLRFGVFISGRRGRSDELRPLYDLPAPDVPTLLTLHQSDPEV